MSDNSGCGWVPVILIVVGGIGAFIYGQHKDKEDAWDYFLSKHCDVRRLEEGRLADTRCMWCTAKPDETMLPSSSDTERAVKERVDKLGGFPALQRGFEVCR